MYARKRSASRFEVIQRINYLRDRIARDIRLNAMQGSESASWVLKHL